MDLKAMREFQTQHEQDKKYKDMIQKIRDTFYPTKEGFQQAFDEGTDSMYTYFESRPRRASHNAMGISDDDSKLLASAVSAPKNTEALDQTIGAIDMKNAATPLEVMKAMGIPMKYYPDVAKVLTEGRKRSLDKAAYYDESNNNFIKDLIKD